jgi:transposase
MLGDAVRTVQYWVKRFEKDGLAGLSEGERSGRPKALTERQIEKIGQSLRRSPEDAGISGNLWDGKTLSAHIKKSYGVSLGVRQCQRMFRQLGFRLRKPRPLIAHADPEIQKRHKKSSGS